MKNILQDYVIRLKNWLEGFVKKLWYAPLMGVLTALDSFIIVIPADGILISSIFLVPKRWFSFSLFMAIGSTIGSVALVYLVEKWGLEFLLEYTPDLVNSLSWKYTSKFFESYGAFVLFVVAATPIFQQPALILAALANMPLKEVTLIVLLGRLIKFLLMGYLASHTPALLSRIWGLKKEIQSVGIEIPKKLPPEKKYKQV